MAELGDGRAMASAGDRAHFDRQLLELLPDALRFATRLTGSVDLAEDVLQSALVRAARSWETFRGDAKLRSWLFRIVINVFRDGLTVVSQAEELPAELEDGREQDVSSTAMTAELGEMIAAKIAALPPRQREVLVLISYEQLGPCEVAEMLGITVANVHATLHTARTRLRRQLAAYLAEK
jgi:RNA polymerase sigma-70 factor (ECF subfamily)